MRWRLLMVSVIALAASCVGPMEGFAEKPTGIFYNVRFVSCYDGDSRTFIVPYLPATFTTLKVRLPGIDTPEMRGKCE